MKIPERINLLAKYYFLVAGSFIVLTLLAPLRDYTYYQFLYSRVLEGGTAYQDFFTAYPLGFVAILYLAKSLRVSFSSFPTYYLTLTLTATLLSFFFLYQILRDKISEKEFLQKAFLVIFIFSPLFFSYYDIFPIFFTILATFFFLKERYKLSFSFLGLGALLKYYPLILVLPFGLFFLARRLPPLKILGALSSLGGVFLGISSLGMLAFGGRGISEPLEYFLSRGLHVESLLGGFLALFPQYPIKPMYAYEVEAPTLATQFFSAVGVAFLFLYAIFARKEILKNPGGKVLAKHVLLAVLVLVGFAKVLSPQFLLWAFPFVFLLYGYTKDTKVFWGYLLVLALTIFFLLFPFYLSLLTPNHLLAALLINARNLALLGYLFYIWRLQLGNEGGGRKTENRYLRTDGRR